MDQTNPFNLKTSPDNSFTTGTLGSRVAEQLLNKIRLEDLAPGARLPSEQAMALHFGVSRTVVREAIATLKAEGILETRKGSGAFVRSAEAAHALRTDRLTEQSIQSLLNVIEVRRGIEAETAALAAVRRSPGQLADIEYALRRIEEAVAGGSDGVAEDAKFHQSIAMATGNPYWVRFVDMFAQTIQSAVKVTRANEARRKDFARQVQAEHEKIVNAIVAGDPELARAAAREHMEQAAQRVRLADREFWRGDGGELARHLVSALGEDADAK
ncbi:FadR/GntR family transcriptional regulator [Noviherbaspirillum sedimenti]|uniref:FadR family transcriptional regulator n=1 Tax=Noviherbaspirillum sedimenti TaxID=2320865 RepID=A0A3A3GAI4_9BURK|nr:FadR/GntR family transcriptional regulator [Noviherbaspirillum sedimenti]RJG03622.1 FadR family transcriptional regulator [Noviherbaspirillum sedimenti]